MPHVQCGSVPLRLDVVAREWRGLQWGEGKSAFYLGLDFTHISRYLRVPKVIYSGFFCMDCVSMVSFCNPHSANQAKSRHGSYHDEIGKVE